MHPPDARDGNCDYVKGKRLGTKASRVVEVTTTPMLEMIGVQIQLLQLLVGLSDVDKVRVLEVIQMLFPEHGQPALKDVGLLPRQ